MRDSGPDRELARPGESLTEQTVPPTSELNGADLRRNFWAFTSEMAFFQVGMTFASSSTILPSLFSRLTDSEIVIGVATGIISVSWMLPQLVAAAYTARVERKKRFTVRVALAFRPAILLVALVVRLWGESAPMAALVLVTLGMFAFYMFDAVAYMPWFDVLHNSLPTRRRGRMQGTGIVLGALGSLIGGVAIRHILSPNSRWGFAANYAILFVIAYVLLMCSIASLVLAREPQAAHRKRKVVPVGQALRELPDALRGDPRFVKIVVLRIVNGMVMLAGTFYVLYGLRVLGFRQEDTGLFVSAQVAGALVSGLVQGVVQDRWGPVSHMRLNIVLSMAPPILALIAGPLAATSPVAGRYLYILVFAALGLVINSMAWPYMNWIIEYAPDDRRTLYIGTINTAAAALVLAPAIGGLIVRLISYQAAFAAALLIAAVALVFSRNVHDTRTTGALPQ